VSDESEKILRHTRKLDKAETSLERRESMSPGDYVSESKELIRIGGDPGENSRVLRLTSIARYRAKRRTTTAEKRLAKALLVADVQFLKLTSRIRPN
jgi:hypothetical protein